MSRGQGNSRGPSRSRAPLKRKVRKILDTTDQNPSLLEKLIEDQTEMEKSYGCQSRSKKLETCL
jgi:transcriptional regulator